jgi:hypothetical protein
LGEWERALSIAPAIGIDYWRALNRRYCKRLLSDSDASKKEDIKETLIPFMLSNGDVSGCVDYLLEMGQIDDAYLLAAMNDNNMFDFSAPVTAVVSPMKDLKLSETDTNIVIPAMEGNTAKSSEPKIAGISLLKKVAAVGYVKQVGPNRLSFGSEATKLGATWKLVTNDVRGGLRCLLNGGELDHALGLAAVFDLTDDKREVLQLIETRNSLLNTK